MSTRRIAHRIAAALGIALSLAGCDRVVGGSAAPAGSPLLVAGPAGVTLGELTLVASQRVGRTLFDYRYRLALHNGGAAPLHDLTATVASAAPATTVVDAELDFGDAAGGATLSSADTFTIRQDRSFPFAASDLRISVRAGSTDPAEGVLLEGDPSDLAVDRLVVEGPLAAAPGDLQDGFLLTRIDLTIAGDATVGQVNGALAAVGGGIVGMRPGVLTLTVAVPRQSSPAALQALAAALAPLPGVRFAFASRSPAPRVAPPAPADTEAQLQHLHDAGFLAAWNARAAAGDCTTNRVRIIVPDIYLQGDGREFGLLYADLAGQLPGVPLPAPDPGETLQDFHGYNVLTTMLAALDETAPTGALPFPECLDVRPIEITYVSYVDINAEIEARMPASGNFIVSHSWGYPFCGSPCRPTDPSTFDMMSALEMAKIGADYRQFLNRHVQRALTVSAAGNERNRAIANLYPGHEQAAYDSPMNVAGSSDGDMPWIRDFALWEPTTPCSIEFCPPSYTASFDDQALFRIHLRDMGQEGASAAPNVLIVGAMNPGGFNEPWAHSDAGEDVFAVGVAIPTVPGTTVQGTSFASPQVSALAAYLWLLSPELRGRPVVDTIGLIEANVCTIVCAGLIDAYASVQALDSGLPLSPANSRIRLALLDVSGDAAFTEADLEQFRNALRPGGSFANPSVRNWSRYDLNGDGYTGGGRTAVNGISYTGSFDLDPEDSPRFGKRRLGNVSTEVLGALATYDEFAVTDSDILCYYAHSPLYTGDLTERNRILFDVCAVGRTYVGSYTEQTNTSTASQQGSSTASATVRAVELEDGTFEVSGGVSMSSQLVTTHQRTGGRPPCTVTHIQSATGSTDSFFANAFGAGFDGSATGTSVTTDTCTSTGQPPIVTTRTINTTIGTGVALAPILDESGAVIGYEGSESGPGGAAVGRVDIIP
jgi:hypothetical protein